MATRPQPTAGGGRQPAPAGELRCRGWEQEAGLRMLRQRAEIEPGGKAAHDLPRPSEPGAAIEAALAQLGEEQTLLLSDGQPPRVVSSSTESVRVCLEANREREWLTTGGQDQVAMAARILQLVSDRYWNGSLTGKLVVNPGLGRAGAALSLASTLAGGVFLGIEADPERIKRQVRAGACDLFIYDLPEAVRVIKQAIRRRESTSIGLSGKAGVVMAEMVRRGIVPDVLTHAGEDADRDRLAEASPAEQRAAMQAMIAAGAAAVDFGGGGFRVGEIATAADDLAASAAPPTATRRSPEHQRADPAGNRSPRAERGLPGSPSRLRLGAAAGATRAKSGEPSRLLQWWALSGEASDLRASEEVFLGLVSADAPEAAWIRSIRQRWRRNGLPARVAWMNLDLAQRFVAALQDWMSRAGARAPILLSHVPLSGSPSRQTARSASEPPDPDRLLTIQNGAAIGVWSRDHGSPRWQQLAFVLDGSRASRRRSQLWMKEI